MNCIPKLALEIQDLLLPATALLPRLDDRNFYPSWLLGFITSNGTREAVIQCLLNPLSWEDIQQKFVVYIEIG
jgi:hypothetical protein